MYMKLQRLMIVAAILLPLSSLAATKSSNLLNRLASPRTLQYYPDGRDIVCQDGDKRYNRAL